MKLTQFTDYALRTLIYLESKQAPSTVGEISQAFNISRNHLTKVVHRLSKKGYLISKKGNQGGISLAPHSASVTVGEIVQALEPNMDLVECFNVAENTCPLYGPCKLEAVISRGKNAFIQELKKVKLSDVSSPKFVDFLLAAGKR